MSDKPLSERITTDFLTRVSRINEAKQDIYESNMLGEHGMRFRDMAMTKGIIVGVKDLSGFAGSQLADKLSIGEAGSPDPYGLEALGKDLHVKAKSSVFLRNWRTNSSTKYFIKKAGSDSRREVEERPIFCFLA